MTEPRFGDHFLRLAEFWEAEAKRLTVPDDTTPALIAQQRRAVAQTLKSCADELRAKVAWAKDVFDSGAFI